MTAIEMVSDRKTKKPIDAVTATIVQQVTYQSGAMIRVSGPNIILSPPLVLTEADVTTILSALDAGFAAAS
jgi:adenosylmethionine-8-amino-7-oxononanoate aminotransferase